MYNLWFSSGEEQNEVKLLFDYYMLQYLTVLFLVIFNMGIT